MLYEVITVVRQTAVVEQLATQRDGVPAYGIVGGYRNRRQTRWRHIHELQQVRGLALAAGQAFRAGFISYNFV